MPEIVKSASGKRLYVCAHLGCEYRMKIVNGEVKQPSMKEIRAHEAERRVVQHKDAESIVSEVFGGKSDSV